MPNHKIPPPRFILQGFSQDAGSRRFVFQGSEEEQFTVHADLTLVRVYGIPIQDLPLLRRELLERRTDLEAVCRFVLTEDDMRQHRADRLAASSAARKRRPPPRRPTVAPAA